MKTITQEEKEMFSLEKREKFAIYQALCYFKWNKAHAAAALGISKRTVRYKVKIYNLENPCVMSSEE